MFSRQFERDPVLIPLPDGRRWKLHDAFTYETDAGLVIVCPEGFITDLASVPRPLWWLYPPFGRYLPAAIVHDKLYDDHRKRLKHYSRAFADAILLEAMTDCNVGKWTKRIIWSFVRLGGWCAWRRTS